MSSAQNRRPQQRRVHDKRAILVPGLSATPLIHLKNSPVPLITFSGTTYVVHHPDGASDAIQRLIDDGAREYGVGLDLEWQPSFFNPNQSEGATNLIQLSTENISVIFWMTHLNGKMPNELRLLMLDANIKKVGFGLAMEDSARLASEFDGLRLGNAIDISLEANSYGFNKSGLKSLAQQLLGVQVSKAQRMSNWGAMTLSHEQIHYAATDAYLSLLLYYKLKAIVAYVMDPSLDREAIFSSDKIHVLAKFASRAPKAAPSAWTLLRKAVNASPLKKYTCDVCQKDFGSEPSYNDHMFTSKHGEPTVKVEVPTRFPAFCAGCKKPFKTADAFVKHILVTRHDDSDYKPQELAWLPVIRTMSTGKRTVALFGGEQLSFELPPLYTLSNEDFERRKLRVDVFSRKNQYAVHSSEASRSTEPLQAAIVPSAPTPASEVVQSVAVIKSSPAARETITIDLQEYQSMKREISRLKSQLAKLKKSSKSGSSRPL